MRVGRNTLINLAGLGIPLLVAVVAIPPLLHALGAERFGLLTLVWAVVSYLGVFDLGLGRVLTQRLALELADPKPARVGALVGTAMALLLLLGSLAGLLLAAAAEAGVAQIRSVSDRQEAVAALWAMAAAMPAVVATAGLRGILEARMAFAAVNLIRLPMGLFTFLGPLAVAWWVEPRLDLIAWVLVAGRWIACVVHALVAACHLPSVLRGVRFDPALVRPMLTDGGWLTISNVVSPLMGYIDRVLIAVLVSAVAVAYYSTPLEVAIKLSIVPAALTAVLFPLFAVQMAQGGGESRLLFSHGVRAVLGVLWPACVGLALFAQELLAWWIDPAFAASSAPLLQIFAIGILVNSLAHIPLTLLQGAGAMRTTACIHLFELPVFVALLWPLTVLFGAWGAALAWMLRMAGDSLLMFWFAWRLLNPRWRSARAAAFVPAAAVVGAGFGGMFIEAVSGRLTWLAAVMLASLLWLLHPALRAMRQLQHPATPPLATEGPPGALP